MKILCMSGNPRYWWMMKLCMVTEKLFIMNNYFFHCYVLFRVDCFRLKKSVMQKELSSSSCYSRIYNNCLENGIVFKFVLLIVGKWFFSEVRRCRKGIETLKRRGKTTFFISLYCFLFPFGYLNICLSFPMLSTFTLGQGHLKSWSLILKLSFAMK